MDILLGVAWPLKSDLAKSTFMLCIVTIVRSDPLLVTQISLSLNL